MIPLPERIPPIVKKIIALPGRLIPYPVQKPVLSLILNEAFREPLRHDELDFLDGARVRIRVTDLNIDWLITVTAERFIPTNREIDEDVSISGESMDFVMLATRQADPDTLFFQRRIRIEGDTEMGLGVKNTMDSMDWDDLPPPIKSLLKGISALISGIEKNRRERRA